MSTHTPGPWRVWIDPERADRCAYIDAPWPTWPSSQTVAHVFHDNDDERDANARLIAAAPELLEALENMMGWQSLAPANVTEHARAAIAKAKGEELQ